MNSDEQHVDLVYTAIITGINICIDISTNCIINSQKIPVNPKINTGEKRCSLLVFGISPTTCHPNYFAFRQANIHLYVAVGFTAARNERFPSYNGREALHHGAVTARFSRAPADGSTYCLCVNNALRPTDKLQLVLRQNCRSSVDFRPL